MKARVWKLPFSSAILALCATACFGQSPGQQFGFTVGSQPSGGDAVERLCRQMNGHSESAVSFCISETKKQGPTAEADAEQRLRAIAQTAQEKTSSFDFLRKRLAEDAAGGYRNMMIETYVKEVESFKPGKKVAVAGQLRTTSIISDFSGQFIGYLSVNQANEKVRKKILSILQSAVAMQGGPTPVVLLGRMGTCQHIVMNVDAGLVPCIGVEDVWQMYDSPGGWSFDQFRTMQPIRDAIER